MSTQSNAPESAFLTDHDLVLFDSARGALDAIKKTFEIWIVIGRAVVRAREIANERGGRDTFWLLLEQQGLAEIAGDKASISRLEKIMARLSEVLAWRETLTARQRIDWAAPNTLYTHCPIFKKIKPGTDGTTEPRLGPMARLKQEKEELKRSNADLEERLYAAENRDGPLFDLEKGSVRDIGDTIAAKVTPNRLTELAAYLTKIAKGKAESKTPPEWVVDEEGGQVAIIRRKRCRIRANGDGQFKHWREVGVFETEGEAKATFAAKFG